MTKYTPNKITYQADVKGKQLVVLSEVFYPEGWTAKVDGKETPILKVNYLLRGIEVADGNHKVELSFDLPKYHSLNNVALISTVILLLLFAVVVYFECKKKKNTKTVE